MINDESVKLMAKGLTLNKSLKSLILWDNSITNGSMVELVESLVTNQTITWLDLDRNNIHMRFIFRIKDIIDRNLKI